MTTLTNQLHGKSSSTLTVWVQAAPTSSEWRLHLPHALSCRYYFRKKISFFPILFFCPVFSCQMSSPKYSCMINILVQVFFNDQNRGVPHFATGMIGRDNAIARHGIHGLYWLFNISVDSAWLIQGMNTIYLKQPRNQSPFQGLMYDYLRLEGPCGC